MKRKKVFKEYEPLPSHFHPKDANGGAIFLNTLLLWAGQDCVRKTVLMQVGFSKVETTIETAKEFRQRLDAAIRCAEGNP